MTTTGLANGGGIALADGAVRQGARGRFNSTGGLTKRQAAFVTAYIANGGIGTAAAKAAGYSDPRAEGWRLSQLAHVRAAIQLETARVIETEGATVGARFMIDAVSDKSLSGSVRLAAAKWLCEAGGHGLAARRAALGLPETAKQPFEMDASELQAFIAACSAARFALEAERDRLAIEGECADMTPNNTPNDSVH